MSIHQAIKALSDPTRRQILEMLREGDLTAGDIADAFEISKPSISHHLEQLRQADLVLSVKKGQFIYYSLHTTVLDDLLTWLMGLRSPIHPQSDDTWEPGSPNNG